MANRTNTTGRSKKRLRPKRNRTKPVAIKSSKAFSSKALLNIDREQALLEKRNPWAHSPTGFCGNCGDVTVGYAATFSLHQSDDELRIENRPNGRLNAFICSNCKTTTYEWTKPISSVHSFFYDYDVKGSDGEPFRNSDPVGDMILALEAEIKHDQSFYFTVGGISAPGKHEAITRRTEAEEAQFDVEKISAEAADVHQNSYFLPRSQVTKPAWPFVVLGKGELDQGWVIYGEVRDQSLERCINRYLRVRSEVIGSIVSGNSIVAGMGLRAMLELMVRSATGSGSSVTFRDDIDSLRHSRGLGNHQISMLMKITGIGNKVVHEGAEVAPAALRRCVVYLDRIAEIIFFGDLDQMSVAAAAPTASRPWSKRPLAQQGPIIHAEDLFGNPKQRTEHGRKDAGTDSLRTRDNPGT